MLIVVGHGLVTDSEGCVQLWLCCSCGHSDWDPLAHVLLRSFEFKLACMAGHVISILSPCKPINTFHISQLSGLFLLLRRRHSNFLFRYFDLKNTLKLLHLTLIPLKAFAKAYSFVVREAGQGLGPNPEPEKNPIFL